MAVDRDQQVLAKLWEWGHFRNPAYPETHNVTEDELPSLVLEHQTAKQAVRSYQEFFAGELDEVVRNIHGRLLITNGEVGPATQYLMAQPRCGCPDYEEKDTSIEMATNEANWPPSCRNEITVSYDFDQLNLDSATIKQAWQLALKSWSDLLVLEFELLPQFTQNSRIWAKDGPLPGPTLAWSNLAANNCAARLQQRYDTLVRWTLILLQKVICHEIGHAIGSGHLRNRNAILYPSIGTIVTPQPADIANMVRLGYERRGVSPPPPVPTPDDLSGTGITTVGSGIYHTTVTGKRIS